MLFPGIDGDRVGARAVSRFVFAGHADRQPEVNLPHFLIVVGVDDRDVVAVQRLRANVGRRKGRQHYAKMTVL
jgi:hypothetical protein